MDTQTVYEIIGYTGSALVVISLAMSSIIRLRIVNLVGASVFTVYGALIGSVPVVLTNLAITVLDVWYLRKELTTREDLTVIRVDGDDPFLAAFLAQHRTDIDSFADPAHDLADAEVHFVMLRNATMAGVFLGTWDDDTTMKVIVDYVAPPYRDLKSGACLYDGSRFAEMGVAALVVAVPDHRQAHYLAEMGYATHHDGSAIKTINRGSSRV